MNEKNELVNIDTSIFIERILEQIRKIFKNNKTNITEQEVNFFENILKEHTENSIKQYIEDNIESNLFSEEIKSELKNIESEIKEGF